MAPLPEADWLRAYRFNGSTFDPGPVDISDVTTPPNSMPGGMLSISAQGDQDGTGIVWACHPIVDDANQRVVDGMVLAIDAGNLKRVLWQSTTDPADQVGKLAKFSSPTVVNGKVYVPTFSGKICAFGATKWINPAVIVPCPNATYGPPSSTAAVD